MMTLEENGTVRCLKRSISFSLAVLFIAVTETANGIPADQDWRAEWEKTLAQAEKEGQVTFYVLGDYQGYVSEFQKRFPKIKVVVAPGRGAELMSRILTERRAGKYLADVFRSGDISANQVYRGKALQSIQTALILPEVRDESKWWQGKHHYQDPESRYIFAVTANVTNLVCANKDLVKASEFKSYWDLLEPKWKGKIVAYDPRAGGYGGTGARFFYYHPGLGPSFLTRLLTEMDLTLSRDRRQPVDWLAAKRVSIYLFCYAGDVKDARAQGLPISVLDTGDWKEGALLWPMTLVFAERAPHPNAAKVFINWLLSRDGQIAVQKEGDTNDSLRIDIPKADVMADIRRREKARYVPIWRPDWIEMAPVMKVVNEAMRERR